MEKIKDIAKAVEGDLIHFKGSLFVIESINRKNTSYFLNVDRGVVIEIKSDTVFSIFRLPYNLK
jgi:hypothetical protein